MCGARLEQTASNVAIDDNDPLDLEAPVYSFEDRSRSAGQATPEFRDRDRQRELVRDSKPVSRVSSSRANSSATFVENPPADTVQEEATQEKQEREAPHRVSGIGGPSFLGLGYEGNSGFVYDKPRNDGFVYDTNSEAPEYLLEEVGRGVSWRAWAVMILLLAGAGLGYIQWRASHNLGPDIATILAGNGAAMDPNHPVITPESPKPPALKPDGESNDASNPASAKDKDATDSSADESAGGESAGKASSTDNGSNAKAASSKSVANEDKNTTDASDNTSKTPEKTTAAASAKDAKESDESAKPESDGPAANVSKTRSAAPAPVEEKAPEPKSLGDKDPLLIQADKYIQGRGVRKSCSTGVNLLRQAMSAGNPEADVKMGALYWSGTCVAQSNVTAYQWFSRAHSLEPKNRWIERSRNSLWARLSADERRRVSY